MSRPEAIYRAMILIGGGWKVVFEGDRISCTCEKLPCYNVIGKAKPPADVSADLAQGC